MSLFYTGYRKKDQVGDIIYALWKVKVFPNRTPQKSRWRKGSLSFFSIPEHHSPGLSPLSQGCLWTHLLFVLFYSRRFWYLLERHSFAAAADPPFLRFIRPIHANIEEDSFNFWQIVILPGHIINNKGNTLKNSKLPFRRWRKFFFQTTTCQYTQFGHGYLGMASSIFFVKSWKLFFGNVKLSLSKSDTLLTAKRHGNTSFNFDWGNAIKIE